jgi:rsbT co-antagonist protein RsbR
MSDNNTVGIVDVLADQETALLDAWMHEQTTAVTRRSDLIKESELRRDSTEFLRLLRQATQKGGSKNIDGPEWQEVRDLLSSLSRSRAAAGFTPSETSTFVFSLKAPLCHKMRESLKKDDVDTLFDAMLSATELIDRLALFTSEVYQKSREAVIHRQQQEMLELSTPVVKLWDGVLAVPLIGTLDSARTQVVMESLLQAIVDTGSGIAIIDITGVPTVDTLVSQHLLKTVAAARLMGAECIISGIRPQIAQTIVHLGVDLSQVMTKATLAEAFVIALNRTGRRVVSRETGAQEVLGSTGRI